MADLWPKWGFDREALSTRLSALTIKWISSSSPYYESFLQMRTIVQNCSGQYAALTVHTHFHRYKSRATPGYRDREKKLLAAMAEAENLYVIYCLTCLSD